MSRALSPVDGHNEHAEMIRELEQKYAEMLRPIRDLNKNFEVSLDVLERYIHEVKNISIETINFANAGLILQSSKEVYARKVDYLEKLFESLQRTAYNVRDKEDEKDGKTRKGRRRKAAFDGLEDYKMIPAEDIPQLPEDDVKFSTHKMLTYITQLRACLLKPTSTVTANLKDVNGDLIGMKDDFRVNWPINQDGMPCDLTLRYEVEQPSEEEEPMLECLDDGPCQSPPCSPPPDSGRTLPPDITSTPVLSRIPSEIPAADNQEAPPKVTRRGRTSRAPQRMTLVEFVYGTKRKSNSKTPTQSKKAVTRRETSVKYENNMSPQMKFDCGSVLKDLTPSEDKPEEKDLFDEDFVTLASDLLPPQYTEPAKIAEDKIEETSMKETNSTNSSSQLTSTDKTQDEDISEDEQSIFGAPADDPVDQQSSNDDDEEEAEEQQDHPVDALMEEEAPGMELDPLNKRIREWEKRILPILEANSNRPRFRLPDYANRILQDIQTRTEPEIACTSVLAHREPHEVSRNFVALLHLCNTRNVQIHKGNVKLLSTEYRLSADDVDSYH